MPNLSQWSQEVQGGSCYDFGMYFDSDSLPKYEGEFKDNGSETEEISEKMEFTETKEFSTVVWLMREKCAWENHDNGLFFCITINDVVKHCLEKNKIRTARNICGQETNRTWKYWHGFECVKSFPDQTSHMLHMESKHDLGFSWDHDWLVPFQVQQEGQSGRNAGVKGRTYTLDDSITVDGTYRTFIVEIKKFASSYQNEKERKFQIGNQFAHRVWHIRKQIQHI